MAVFDTALAKTTAYVTVPPEWVLGTENECSVVFHPGGGSSGPSEEVDLGFVFTHMRIFVENDHGRFAIDAVFPGDFDGYYEIVDGESVFISTP